MLCEIIRTMSLISHPTKAMLCISLNRLKRQALQLPAEEQVGLRAILGSSTAHVRIIIAMVTAAIARLSDCGQAVTLASSPRTGCTPHSLHHIVSLLDLDASGRHITQYTGI
ncbi:hypothetical protein DPMN_020829 [Dreissena polymorpha]|uniref:Uncharacterized protein n=1 Tax=Dreissena polymorpha TaxID=45954 RepID=A0A9D4NLV4_DREPO|nr:hypothetical protein DPMN_020829 [Dreissena polymorpha]